MSIINIRQLEYFIAVAEHLNFTKAAERLFVVQSSISQQIAELEEHLGVRLFYRNKRQVRLTAEGIVFYKDAKSILDLYGNMLRNVNNSANGIVGTLHFGISGRSLRVFLPDLLKKFRESYPDIEFRFTEYNHASQVDALKNDDVDVIFPMRISIIGVPGIKWEHIFYDDNAVVVPSSHLMAEKEEVDLKSLAEEQFIFLHKDESPFGYYSKMRMCIDCGFTPNIACEVKNVDTVLWLIESGVGISILPKSVEIDSTNKVKFLKISNHESLFEVCAAWSNTNENPAVQLFLDLLRTDSKIKSITGRNGVKGK